MHCGCATKGQTSVSIPLLLDVLHYELRCPHLLEEAYAKCSQLQRLAVAVCQLELLENHAGEKVEQHVEGNDVEDDEEDQPGYD